MKMGSLKAYLEAFDAIKNTQESVLLEAQGSIRRFDGFFAGFHLLLTCLPLKNMKNLSIL